MQNVPVDKCFELLNEATEAVAGIAEEVNIPSVHDGSDVLKTNLAVKSGGYDSFLIDSGAAYSTTPSADGLSDLQRLKKILNLEYADGSIGTRIESEGTLFLNGHEVRALVSPDLKEGLLSTPQMDKELNATTVQTDGRSITFIPDERQEQVLDILLKEMNPDNVVADAKLNDDGLYEVKYKRDQARTLSVTVFPRVAANSSCIFTARFSWTHAASFLNRSRQGCLGGAIQRYYGIGLATFCDSRGNQHSLCTMQSLRAREYEETTILARSLF